MRLPATRYGNGAERALTGKCGRLAGCRLGTFGLARALRPRRGPKYACFSEKLIAGLLCIRKVEGLTNSDPKIRVLASEIETWQIDDLAPYARNAKKHPPEQVAQIAASMREFGFTIPVLAAEDGTIIAGHGRVLAAQEIGLAEVPVIVARGWSDAQRRAYTLADNKLSENGEWDEDLLKIELGDLGEEGFDVDLIGFSTKELDKLLDFAGTDGETDPDETPEPEEVAVSKHGDIWLLGAYYECEACGKRYSYEEGRALGEECGCDGA